MTFFKTLGRQRHILQNLGNYFRKTHPQSPLVEALEPRALFSMVPTGISADLIAQVTDSTHVSAAATADGQYVVAWLGKRVDNTAGLFFNVYDTSGTLISSNGDNTGFIAVSGVADFEITVNEKDMGAIAWLSNDVVHAQRIDLALGSLLGSEAQVTAAVNTDITNIHIALDSNGQIALLWEQAATYKVKPTASTANGQEENVSAESLYLALNAKDTTTWSAATTVVNAADKAKVGSFASIADSDLAIGSDGNLIVAWQASNMSFVYDSEFGKYWPRFTSMDTSFQKYSPAGAAVGTAVAVGHKNATHSIEQASIKIMTDRNGTLAIAQNVSYTVANDNASWAGQSAYDVLTLRTYDAKNKALSAETEIARSSIDGEIGNFTGAFDGSHNLIMMWQRYNSVTDSATDYTQAYSAKGAKIGATATLNIDHNNNDSVDSLTLLSSSTGFRTVYLASSYDSGTSSTTGGVMMQLFGDSVGDLKVAIGANTLPPTITAGTISKVNLPVIVTNSGNARATGTATITVQLVPVNGGNAVTLATLSGQLLNIDAGKSKTYTFKNLTILPKDYVAAGDFKLVATITDVAATSNVNTSNDSAAIGLAVANGDSTVDDIAVTSVTAAFTQSVLVPGDNGTVSVVLRNTGTTNIVQASVTLNISATTNGQYNSALKLASKTVIVSLKPGASMTFKLPVSITSALTQGNYRFAAQAILPTSLNDDNAANNTAATDNGTDVVWSFGNVAGRKGSTNLVWQYDNGTKVTYGLSGPGTGMLELNAGNLPGNSQAGDAGVLDLSYMETTSASKLSVTVTGGLGYSAIGNIAGFAEIGSISAAKTNLRGNASLMTLAALTLGNLTAGAPQEIDIDSQSAKTVNITLGNAADLMLKSDMAIGTLTAVDWSGSEAYLETRSINSLKITGDKKTLAGDLKADIVLSGAASAKAATLASATIAGTLSGLWNVTGAVGSVSVGGLMTAAAIRATGNIASISAGAAVNASILAGVTSGVQDVLTTNATKLLPTDAADFASATPKISAITFKGKVGTAVTESKDFYIAAPSVGTLKLGRVAPGNAAAYGMTTFISPLSLTRYTPYSSITLTYSDAGKDTTITLTPAAKDIAAKLAALKTALHFGVNGVPLPVVNAGTGELVDWPIPLANVSGSSYCSLYAMQAVTINPIDFGGSCVVKNFQPFTLSW